MGGENGRKQERKEGNTEEKSGNERNCCNAIFVFLTAGRLTRRFRPTDVAVRSKKFVTTRVLVLYPRSISLPFASRRRSFDELVVSNERSDRILLS